MQSNSSYFQFLYKPLAIIQIRIEQSQKPMSWPRYVEISRIRKESATTALRNHHFSFSLPYHIMPSQYPSHNAALSTSAPPEASLQESTYCSPLSYNSLPAPPPTTHPSPNVVPHLSPAHHTDILPQTRRSCSSGSWQYRAQWPGFETVPIYLVPRVLSGRAVGTAFAWPPCPYRVWF